VGGFNLLAVFIKSATAIGMSNWAWSALSTRKSAKLVLMRGMAIEFAQVERVPAGA
jgi:hypothetical protein